jgi:ATP-dependent Zn protease
LISDFRNLRGALFTMTRFEVVKPGQSAAYQAPIQRSAQISSSVQQTLPAPPQSDSVYFGATKNTPKTPSTSNYLSMLALLAGLTAPGSPAHAETPASQNTPIPIAPAMLANAQVKASQIKGRIVPPHELLDIFTSDRSKILGKVFLPSKNPRLTSWAFQIKSSNNQSEYLLVSTNEDVDNLVSRNLGSDKGIPEIDAVERISIELWANKELQKPDVQAAILERAFQGFYQAKQENPNADIAEMVKPWLNRLIESGKVTKALISENKDKFEFTLKPDTPGGKPLTFNAPASGELLQALQENKVDIPNIDEITPNVISKFAEEHDTLATLGGTALVLFIVFYALQKVQMRGMGLKQAKTFNMIPPERLKVDMEDVGGLSREFKKDMEKRTNRILQENKNITAKLKQMRASKNPLAWAYSRLSTMRTGQSSAASEKPLTEAEEKLFNETGKISLKPSIPYTGDTKFQTLLVGDPGTGKTMLAKAVAKRLGIPFLSISGGDFMQMFVGVGAQRVRELFKTAEKYSPCMIFIDEFDTIATKRGFGAHSGSSDEKGQTLNTLLSFLDGLNSAAGITVMAATNAPVEMLDPAIIRPGRFEVVNIPAPKTDAQRIDIMEKVLKSLERDIKEKDSTWKGPLAVLSTALKPEERSKYAPNQVVDVERFAKLLRGESGAMISGTLKAAVELARDEGAEQIRMIHILQGYEKARMGAPEPEVLEDPASERSRELVAWHEGGHALMAKLWNKVVEQLKLSNVSSVQKGKDPYEIAVFSMTPRGGSLGHVLSLENLGHKTLLDMIGQSLLSVGGRAAEEIMGEDILAVCNGGMGDWEQVREELKQFILSGAIRGNNTSTLKRNGFDNQPELSEKELAFVDRWLERSLSTAVNAMNQMGRQRLDNLVQDALKLAENTGSGDLFLDQAEGFFEKHLAGIDWEPLVNMVDELIIQPTRQELEDARKQAITNVGGTSAQTIKRKLPKRGQPA